MIIFIDESGPFVPLETRRHSVSCVAGLAVPSSIKTELFSNFERLKTRLGLPSTEVKGSSLDEPQVSAIVTMLSRFPVILCITAIDIGVHLEAEVEEHQQRFVSGITANLDPSHSPEYVREVNELAASAADLPPQLYAQATALSNMVDHIIQVSTAHYAQSIPKELGEFKWIIDAKGARLTEYEKLWSSAVKPTLEARSLENPTVFISDADYSYFAPFDLPDSELPPAHFPPFERDTSKPFSSVNIKKIIDDDMAFLDSCAETGLQIVDVLANAFRRACNGNLKRRGWRNLGSLMVKDPRSGKAVDFVAFCDAASSRSSLLEVSYAKVLRETKEKARDIV